jgi:DNA (cytosine-5)-methyltransferase 1
MTSVGSLCSGYDGIQLALQSISSSFELSFVAEIEQHASDVLAAHWPHVPNLGDISTIDWASTPGVDVITAGYPCQPFSLGGKRQGERDRRHIWPHVLNAVRVLRPRLVLLENVAGHLSLGFGRVLGDLAEAGYDARWLCLRASDVGAPHRRERVFVAAADADASGHEVRARSAGRSSAGTGSAERAAADADSDRHERLETLDGENSEVGEQSGDDADRRRVSVGFDFTRYREAVERWERVLERAAPPGLVDGRLNVRFVEWMMGLPAGHVTDHVSRRHALQMLGNGVVPQQAAAAFRALSI